MPRSRRRRDSVLVVAASLLIGVVALVAALAGDTERIGSYWTSATIDASGHAEVVEVIDYDFGPNRRHGILRDIPGVDPAAAQRGEIVVSSPSAPDDLTVSSTFDGVELRVGDPDVTVSNRHRYTITYPHDGLVAGDELAWNAVGDGWDVTVHDIEVHVLADRELTAVGCDYGVAGSTGGCTAAVVGPGHLVARIGRVPAGDAVTVRARLGAAVTPDTVDPPTGRAHDPGTGWKPPALVALLAAVAGASIVSVLVRRAGREWVWDGGPTVAAFGPDDTHGADRVRIDVADLAEMSTIEFEPPREFSATVGGVILDERVTDAHKTAWLLERAISGEVDLDVDGSDTILRRGAATPAADPVAKVLDTMFHGREKVDLSKYSAYMAKGWERLESDLEHWFDASTLWDAHGRRNRRRAIVLGVVAAVVGLAALVTGAVLANRHGSGWLTLVMAGALAAGGGVAAAVRSWELMVRTPRGSGVWLRIESFRRFLHDSEADHVERAAELGRLREYAAWATALGEVERWNAAVAAAVAVPGSAAAAASYPPYLWHATVVGSAMHTATTAPSSSSGGGGGFSGGAGGGGGGGGGGSW